MQSSTATGYQHCSYVYIYVYIYGYKDEIAGYIYMCVPCISMYFLCI